ncbi:MAG TPA: hypothetical protein VNT75_19210 [Symbiobacteriaceae bacterium]|nr:hypothetical protein [Symbiobacteriaceae bacterium]
MANVKLIEEARRILDDVTPLAFDCGTLCGQKCCTSESADPDEELGVYLIPGELPLFDGSEDWLSWRFHSTDDFEFAPAWEKHGQIPFMVCHKLCRREKRPFECRTYPLVPLRHDDGRLEMRYAPWSRGFCPLPDRYKVEDLQPEFVTATQKAWSVLLQDPDMLEHVRWLSEQIKAADELPFTPCEDDDV